jgi:hypothetical protein
VILPLQGIIKWLFPVKELIRVMKIVADQINVHGPKTKLSLKKVAKYTSLADRVIISYKCKGLCVTKRYKCFKEGKKCSVYYYDLAKHDCGFLISLTLRIKVTIKDNLVKKRGTKRLRADTIGKVVKK